MANISKIGLRFLLACLIVCLCLAQPGPLPDETTEIGSAAKYVAPHSNVSHWVSYRQHVSHKFSEQKVFVHFLKDTPKKLLYALQVLTVLFLFVIQTRLKWIMLMPIKYRSEFVIFRLEGDVLLPERGHRQDEIHQAGNGYDSKDHQRLENVCSVLAFDRNRADRRELHDRVANRTNIKSWQAERARAFWPAIF